MNLYEQIRKNKQKTGGLVFVFIVFAIVVVDAIGYLLNKGRVDLLSLTVTSAIIVIVYSLFAYFQSAKIALSLNHAVPTDDQRLTNIISDMAMVAQVPIPQAYLIESDEPNAFATGRDPEHSAIAVTTGLLALMNREELESVIGHEMSHIKNYDIRLTAIVTALGSFLIFLTNFIGNWMWFGSFSDSDRDDKNSGMRALGMIVSVVIILLTSVLVFLLQMAISRNREYLADATSVKLTGDPTGMINALEKLKTPVKSKTSVSALQASAYITQPKSVKTSMFDTHPSLDDRIARLEKM